MGWWYLLCAGLMEIGWPIGIKYALAPEGFRWPPALAAGVCMLASFGLMMLAFRTIPIGTVYAVWTGIGSVGAVTVGIWLFNEPATAARITCATLIVVGVVGLKLCESHDEPIVSVPGTIQPSGGR